MTSATPAQGARSGRAFWVTGPSQGAIDTQKLPDPGASEVRVRALFSAVSRGTESLVFRNAVPASEHGRMRAPFQEGRFPAPVKYGYANVGVVEAGPSALLGRVVFCLFPHQDVYVVPADAVSLVPSAVPPGRAVLAANMESALNGLWDAAPCIGARIAVVGAGVVGCLAAYLAGRMPGTEVTLVDVDPAREPVAAALGVGFAAPDEADGEADLVIHASGAPAGLATALGLAGFEACVLEMSWYGDRAVAVPLGEAFHSKRLVLRSSQVGSVAPGHRARWSRRRRLDLALELLDDPALDALITGESAFDDLPAVMARLAEAPEGALCHRIRYGG